MSTATQDKTYNGWANYESWLLALWIDNEQYHYEMAREFVAEHGPDNWGWGKTHDFREWTELNVIWPDGEDPPASFQTDLILAALDEVDWNAVAEHFADGES